VYTPAEKQDYMTALPSSPHRHNRVGSRSEAQIQENEAFQRPFFLYKNMAIASSQIQHP
jgi:hypothetical protein